MIKQFNVGDTVRYSGKYNPSNQAWSRNGTIFEVDTNHVGSCGTKKTCYSVRWADGSTNCMYFKDGLELVKSADSQEPTIKSAKEAKVALESEILLLIQDFNKKTNLEVKDVSLVCYKDTRGYCQQVNVKVEI